MAHAKYSDTIIALYDKYIESRDALKWDDYMNTKAEKALHTRRFNKLHDACLAEGLSSMTVICDLNEERRDKSVIHVVL